MRKFEVLIENIDGKYNFPERLFLIQTFIFVKRAFEKVRSS